MFEFLKKTVAAGNAAKNYAINVGKIFTNLEKVDGLEHTEAKKEVLRIAMFTIAKIYNNKEMDYLDLNLKVRIHELYGLKRITVAYSMAAIISLLFEYVKKYDLQKEYQEILDKTEHFK